MCVFFSYCYYYYCYRSTQKVPSFLKCFWETKSSNQRGKKKHEEITFRAQILQSNHPLSGQMLCPILFGVRSTSTVHDVTQGGDAARAPSSHGTTRGTESRSRLLSTAPPTEPAATYALMVSAPNEEPERKCFEALCTLQGAAIRLTFPTLCDRSRKSWLVLH